MTTNKDLFAKHVHLGTFIETGTAYGRSVGLALDLGFHDIRSVEGDQRRAGSCEQYFRGQLEVRLWHGESVATLPIMLRGVTGPALFWLDAHPSGAESYGQDYETNPAHAQSAVLRAELELIHARKMKGDVILIDDLTDDIQAFARERFPRAQIQIHDTDEGLAKVMEIQI